MEQIDSSQIHLWLAFPDEIRDPRLLKEYRLLLSEEELQKQARFRFERDRHRYLVTRAMVRTVLSEYAHVAPCDWTFVNNAYGKPSIAPRHSDAQVIEFNVSHTDGLVLMGIACERAIGVDVESVRMPVDIQIADRYFALAEVAALRALPTEQQQHRFLEYWTLKESYIKARGTGLSIPLDRFEFELGLTVGIRLRLDPILRDSGEAWRFWQPQVGRNHVAAVCAKRCSAERLQIGSVRDWLRRKPAFC